MKWWEQVRMVLEVCLSVCTVECENNLEGLVISYTNDDMMMASSNP